MRVLVVTNQWPRPDRPISGAMVVRQVDSLRQVDLEPTVLSIDGRSARAYLRAARSLFAMNFRRRVYDVVHAHTGHSGILAGLQLRVPVVCSYVGYDLDPISEREPVRRRVERTVFRWLSILVSVPIVKSRRSLERLPTSARRRATVLPNGVDRRLFRPMPRERARSILGWEEGPVVLFAGQRWREVKRFALAEAAVAEARKRDPSIRLEVAEQEPPDDMPAWMNGADVLLLTSVSEGSPNVVKEAMACDLPVVSVDVGDVTEVVAGTQNCYVCPADAAALGDAILRVLAARPERSDGRERTQHLDEREIAHRLRTVYETAMTRGPGFLGWIGRRA
jgi:glycosyltransferase involved in cell wall biosynthesis